jgi:hypothetical protein
VAVTSPRSITLTLHKAEDILRLNQPLSGIDKDKWESVQRRMKAYLCLYIKLDMYLLIASNTDYPTFKDKWEKIRETWTYGGASDSTTIFNL